MERDPEELLRQRKALIERFQARAKPIIEMSIEMARLEEITEWQQRAFSERPNPSACPSSPQFVDELARENEYLDVIVPDLPTVNPNYVRAIVGSSTTGTSMLLTDLEKWGRYPAPQVQDHSRRRLAEYRALQDKQDRVGQLRELIGKTGNPETIGRLETAEDAYRKFKAGHVTGDASAFMFRNLLEGVAGDLENGARRFPKEHLSWGNIADRIVKGGLNDSHRTRFRLAESAQTELHNALSQTGKHHLHGERANLDILWTKLLDHLYNILTLVDLKKE